MNVPPTLSGAPPKRFQFVGGALCLDFCNSVGGKRGARAREYLNSYMDFVSWSQQAGLVEHSQAEAKLLNARRQPAEAATVLERAVALREAIYRIFLAVAEKKRLLGRDLEELNAELGHSLNRLRIAPNKNGFAWEWSSENGTLDEALG